MIETALEWIVSASNHYLERLQLSAGVLEDWFS